MRYWFVLVFSGALLLPAMTDSAFADDSIVQATLPTPPTLTLPAGDRLFALTPNGRNDPQPQTPTQHAPDRDRRRAVLSALHAVTGVVQTYDGMLTMRVLDAGGKEANPLMKPVAGSERVMLGVKIAAAVATVIGAETLWRDNHRVAALVTSLAANSAMAMIARHNAQVLARLEGR
jgi:hypothetical protein